MPRSTTCVRVIILCLTVLGFAFPAAAQDVPKREFSIGYQFLRASQKGDSKNLLGGWYFDFAGNVNKMLGIVGGFGGGDRTFKSIEQHREEFMGGVRVGSRKNKQAVPFAQVLAGAVRQTVGTNTVIDGGLQVGGGVNLMPKDRVGVRVGVDYLRVFSSGEGTNVVRVDAGVVLPFGMTL